LPAVVYSSLTQELSYDPWGRLRPNTQVAYAPDTEPILFLSRGYTCHEHLAVFGLINMNARLYDAALGRFLSPDPYVQAPDFSQNFNRYSYCVNNPLKYSDQSGEFFFIFPHISWSKSGGLSIGITVGLGIPGLGSVQAGIGYNTKSGGYGFVGASVGFNSVSLSYSGSGGWSVGYSAGLSIQNGFPIGTNFATAGVNYNLSHGGLSGNFSAFSIDSKGITFDPSFSAMLFPEHFTNLVKGGGFRSNQSVFERIKSGEFNPYHRIPNQWALDYFGFDGKYQPQKPAGANYMVDQNSNYYGACNPVTGEILFGNYAFDSYDKLKATITVPLKSKSII
jgi:RHS repeat-associated protein